MHQLHQLIAKQLPERLIVVTPANQAMNLLDVVTLGMFALAALIMRRPRSIESVLVLLQEPEKQLRELSKEALDRFLTLRTIEVSHLVFRVSH